MPGRWRNVNGVAEWEEGVNAPNQIDAPSGFDPSTGQALPQQQQGGGMVQAPPLQPSGGENTGIVPPQQQAGGGQQPFQREQFRDAWQSSGITNIAGLNQFLQQYGIGPASGNGTVTLPNGEQIDMLQGARTGQGTAAWGGVGGGGGGAGGISPQTFGASGGAGGGGTGNPSTDQAMRDMLLQLMQRSQPSDINPNEDPNLAPQARAYSAARTRAAQRQRSTAAERAAFTGENLGGQGGGAFDSTVNSIQEGAGQDIAGYEAGLVGQEMQARRSDLLNALQLANAVGARDQSAQIQMQLANLDAQIRRESLAQQGSIANANLGFQQSQWNDQYGLAQQQFTADQNRFALLAALGG